VPLPLELPVLPDPVPEPEREPDPDAPRDSIAPEPDELPWLPDWFVLFVRSALRPERFSSRVDDRVVVEPRTLTSAPERSRTLVRLEMPTPTEEP